MLCWILIVGGLLIMMGQHDRSEALFYYFRLEDQVPETHLLRLIEKHISFAFVRKRLKASYSDTGRPSIDPELLLRILPLVICTASPAAQAGGRAAHAPGLALVHRPGF
jgi:transposase